MTNVWVLHEPSGIVLDLFAPGYGHPDGEDIINDCYEHCHKDGPLFCVIHGAIYLRKIGQQTWAVHFDGNHAPHLLPAPMLDKHKRMVDSWVWQPEREGLSVGKEINLNTGSRPDWIVERQPGEVQRSGITVKSAVSRTLKAVQAGLLPSIWSAENPFRAIGRKHSPLWAYKVPSVGLEPLPWDEVHDPHTVKVVSGLRRIKLARCDGTQGSCPDRSVPCNKMHAWPTPVALSLAELSVRLVRGTVIPLRIKIGKNSHIYLTNPDGIACYEEWLGKPVEPLYLGTEQEQQARPQEHRPLRECLTDPVIWEQWRLTAPGTDLQPALWDWQLTA